MILFQNLDVDESNNWVTTNPFHKQLETSNQGVVNRETFNQFHHSYQIGREK